MNIHQTTQTTLAADVFDRLIQLDAVLSIADLQDHAELLDRLKAVEIGEFKHVLAFASLASVALEPVGSAAVAGEVEEG